MISACESDNRIETTYVETRISDVCIEQIGRIEFPHYGEGLFEPGEIDSNDSMVFLGNTGYGQITGVTAYSWSEETVWRRNVAFTSPALCADDSLLCMSLYCEQPPGEEPEGQLVFVETESGDERYSIRMEELGFSNRAYYPDEDGVYMPMPVSAQGIGFTDSVIVINIPICMQRFGYCGFLTDMGNSYYRYLKIYQDEEGRWYIGFTNGHDESGRYEFIEKYLLPDDSITCEPGIYNIALTDSSIVTFLSRRDIILEFSHEGRLISAYEFGHVLDGPLEFHYDKLASNLARCLIADIDLDEQGYIYILYSGYGSGQNGNAEIVRFNPQTLKSESVKLDHSAAAFTVSGEKVCVVGQEWEIRDDNQYWLTGVPCIYMYRIQWDV